MRGSREVAVAVPHLTRTDAVVLRRHDFGETDRILTLYTANLGKLRAVAKGVRRPISKLAGHLELFTHAHVMLAHGRNLDIITQVETVSSFIGLREDLWRTSQAYYVAELLDRLTEERAENAALFRLLITTLDRIATVRRPDQAVRFFEAQALGLLGYRPELRHCVTCQAPLEPRPATFSVADGGVICQSCPSMGPSTRSLSANALKVLRLYQDGDWPTVNRLRLNEDLGGEVEQILRGYVHYIAEAQLKSTAFVTSLRQQRLIGSLAL